MPVYAIGDIQGCYAPLQALLRSLRFDPAHDQLWFTGDLVNRGPQSLEVLRFIKRLGTSAVCVLGNHDLHLLALAAGRARVGRHNTLEAVLRAPDRDALLNWLRCRPLLYHDPTLGFTLVHAGLAPQWDLATALALAAEVETRLRNAQYAELFAQMYGDTPDRWDETLTGWDRIRVIINAMTRLRYCDAAGRMALGETGPPGSQPKNLLPWFTVPNRLSQGLRIVFGHWSTLGRWVAGGVIGLDSGCLWGGALSAVRLDAAELEFFGVPCPQAQAPY